MSDQMFPIPIPVTCVECGEYVGEVTSYRQAADLAMTHKQVCEKASEWDKKQALFDKLFCGIADQLTKEGFLCQ